MSTDRHLRPGAAHGDTRVRFLVLGWLCLLATLAYIHRSSLAVPAERIRDQLQFSRAQMAQIMSAFFLGYAIFQLPGGWLGDRWGSRTTLTLIVLLWSAATGCMGLMDGFTGMYICWLLAGTAQAAIFPCCVNTVSHWFPPNSRAFPNGMLGSFMSVGGVIGAALTAFLLWELEGDWRLVFQLLAMPGIAAAVVFWQWFRNQPHEHSWVSDDELRIITGDAVATSVLEPRPPTPWLAILTNVPVLLVCAQQFCRASGYIFFLTWFPTFLRETRNVSEVQAGYFTSLPLLGVVVGSALGGWLMDWLSKRTGERSRSRRGVAVLSLLACGAIFSAAYFVSDPLLTVGLLAVGSIGAGMCGPAAYTTTIDMGGRHVGTVFSIMNTAGNIGSFLMPMLVDRLVTWRGWHDVMLLLAGLYLAAAVCWMLVRDRPVQPASTFSS